MDKKPATAKAFTDEEKWEIKENGKYILTAMDTIGKNGDAYCTDESLFRVSKTVRPDLTKQQFYMDKSLLLQAAFLHQEGCHLYAQRTWEYEVTAAEQLADILKDPAFAGRGDPERAPRRGHTSQRAAAQGDRSGAEQPPRRHSRRRRQRQDHAH